MPASTMWVSVACGVPTAVESAETADATKGATTPVRQPNRLALWRARGMSVRGAYGLTSHDQIKSTLATAWFGRPAIDSGLLAAQLDPPRRADLLSILPALAWLYSCGRRSRLDTRRQFALVAFTKKICAALLFFGTGLVVVRADQSAHRELAISRAGAVQSVRVQSACHGRILDCRSGSI